MTPRTPTGKRLDDAAISDGYDLVMLPDIRAIETEAAAMERERLRSHLAWALEVIERNVPGVHRSGQFGQVYEAARSALADPEPTDFVCDDEPIPGEPRSAHGL